MTNTNEYLVYGWNVQQLGNTVSQTGYSFPGVVPPVAAVSTALQVSGGFPSPIGAENIQGENSGAYTAQILTNPGYADGQTLLGAVTAPAVPLTTVAVQNPYGLAALVTVTGGTVTLISIAPWATSAGSATFSAISTGETTSEVQVTVPGGGFIKMTYSSAPTWTWITTN